MIRRMIKTEFIKIIGLSIIAVVLILACSSPLKESNPYLEESQGYIEVEGGKIWYGIMGEGNKTPLLCLHGGPGSTSQYYYHLSEIAKERPVIMFDQLGSGRSDHHKDTSLLKVKNFVEQVRAIKTELKLNQFYLLGGSWGTALSLEYYNAYPDGVKAIVFNSPFFSTPIWTADADTLVAALPDSIQTIIKVAEIENKFDTDDYANADRLFLSKHGRRTAYKKHPYDTIKSSGNSFIYNYMWGPSEFTATGTLKNYDIHETLKDIEVPVLFTTGEFDEARPETVVQFSKLVPNSEFVVIEAAGHSTLNDNSPALVLAIREFISKIEQ